MNWFHSSSCTGSGVTVAINDDTSTANVRVGDALYVPSTGNIVEIIAIMPSSFTVSQAVTGFANQPCLAIPVAADFKGAYDAIQSALAILRANFGEDLNTPTGQALVTQTVLNQALAGKSNIDHNHDGRYVTPTQLDAAIDNIDVPDTTDLTEYRTITEINAILQGYTSDSDLNTALQAYTNTQNLSDILSGYVTSQQLNNAIDNIPTFTIPDEYVTDTELANALNPYRTAIQITAEISAAVNGVTVDLSEYRTITQIHTLLESYVTDAELQTAINNITPTDLSAYVTTSSLATTLASYRTAAQVTDEITAARNAMEASHISDSELATQLAGYVTDAELQTAIGNIAPTDLSGYVTTSSLNTTLGSYVLRSVLDDYSTTVQVNSLISSVLTDYSTTSQINNLLNSYLTQTAADNRYVRIGQPSTEVFQPASSEPLAKIVVSQAAPTSETGGDVAGTLWLRY